MGKTKTYNFIYKFHNEELEELTQEDEQRLNKVLEIIVLKTLEYNQNALNRTNL